MRVIIKEPNKDAYATDIENTLRAKQRIVGGYIEVVPFGMDHLLILNEEGKLEELEPNIVWNNDIVVGTIILVRDAGEEFGDIKAEEERYMIQMLNKASV